MAEGFAKTLGKNIVEAHSGGSRPSGIINDRAIIVMREAGVDLQSQHSKGLPDLPDMRWDYVVTMGCGDACPNVAARHRIDWQIPDPKHLSLEEFRKVRDQIEKHVRMLLHEIERESYEQSV